MIVGEARRFLLDFLYIGANLEGPMTALLISIANLTRSLLNETPGGGEVRRGLGVERSMTKEGGTYRLAKTVPERGSALKPATSQIEEDGHENNGPTRPDLQPASAKELRPCLGWVASLKPIAVRVGKLKAGYARPLLVTDRRPRVRVLSPKEASKGPSLTLASFVTCAAQKVIEPSWVLVRTFGDSWNKKSACSDRRFGTKRLFFASSYSRHWCSDSWCLSSPWCIQVRSRYYVTCFTHSLSTPVRSGIASQI